MKEMGRCIDAGFDRCRDDAWWKQSSGGVSEMVVDDRMGCNCSGFGRWRSMRDIATAKGGLRARSFNVRLGGGVELQRGRLGWSFEDLVWLVSGEA